MSAVEDLSLNETDTLLAHLAVLPTALGETRAALAAPLPDGSDQFCAHGRAWAATYVETLTQMAVYAGEMQE
ncbi:MAG: hypothetical protein L7U47_07970, partial [Alphaproteobacteria bacterium]|nr:hypothetical protein [Alphaproteobacteria bacterium]